jgi:hypothetical protein
VNRNILVTSGKEIKRDSIISVNESRAAYLNIRICNNTRDTDNIIYIINYNINRLKKIKNFSIKRLLQSN